MKKNITLLLLIVVIVINSLFMFWVYYDSHQGNNKLLLLNQYNIQKINEISDKIIDREPVEEAYFYYLEKDNELMNEIEQYNRKTRDLKQFFTKFALNLVSDICQLEGFYFINDDGMSSVSYSSIDYTKMPSDVHNLVDLIVNYSLQKNCADLINADPTLLQIIVDSLGGSYGMWPENLHDTLKIENPQLPYSELEDYFDLTKSLLKKLENYKHNLY